jgi:hypothetical protein
MAANDSGGIKMNVGRLLQILFFCPGFACGILIFARGFARGSRQNKSLTNKIRADLPAGKKKDSDGVCVLEVLKNCSVLLDLVCPSSHYLLE